MCFCLGAGTSTLTGNAGVDAKAVLDDAKQSIKACPDEIRQKVEARMRPEWDLRRHWRAGAGTKDFANLSEWLTHAGSPEGDEASISRNLTVGQLDALGTGIADELSEMAEAFGPILDYVYSGGAGSAIQRALDEYENEIDEGDLIKVRENLVFHRERFAELFGSPEKVDALTAEDPEGTPVFEAVAAEPPTTEEQFEGLWKLYFLSLVGDVLTEWRVKTDSAKDVFAALEEANLLQPKASLARRLQAVREYVARFFQPKSVETTLAVDPNTGIHKVTGKITLGEPSQSQSAAGFMSLDNLLRRADDAMTEMDITVWIVLDRLDVAFARNETLETNALRALFAAYLDMKALKRIALKVFLRSDIWDRESLKASSQKEAISPKK